jgi:glycosyltransferase involved in cell wall biosynthesis
MRLIYPDPHAIPDRATVPLNILQNVDALAEIGINIALVTPKPVGDTKPQEILGRKLNKNVAVYQLPDVRRKWYFPSSSNKPFYLMVGRWIQKQSADAILLRNLKLAAYLLSLKGLPPMFFELHEIFAETYAENHRNRNFIQRRKLSVLREQERAVYSNARGLITTSNGIATDLRNVYSVSSPIVVLPNGVDFHLASITHSTESNPIPVLLYLGNLHPWKGIDVLLQAMRLVTGAVLHIAGGSRDRILQLTELANSLGIGEKVQFLGPIEPLDRFERIASSDICLLPSTITAMGSRYTSPLKLFEYLAMGKPVITSDLPAMREVLQHGKNAWMVKPGDARALAEGINAVLTNSELRNDLGKAAAAYAKNFTLVGRAKKIEAFVHANLSQ